MVVCEVFVLRACQVPLQVPAWEDVRLSGGSPFENVATTDPFTMREPQSSTTRTSIGLGQPAAILKLSVKVVKTGASRVGWQAASARRKELAPAGAPAPGAGTTTKSRLTVRVTAPGK